MIYTQFHKNFKLHGKSFQSSNDLIDFSKTISVEVAQFLQQWFDKNSYVEVKTSGSTGKPKVIQLHKLFIVNSAKATGAYFNLPKNTTALLCMSPNYIAGKMMLVRALTLGWHLDVVEPISNPLKSIGKSYEFSAMVPLQLNISLSDIHKVKKLIVGGGAISKELLTRIQDVDTEIFATYGMTETITHIAVKKLNKFRQSEHASASYYKTLSNISISEDKRGCLVIDASKVSEEIVVTNDLVEILSSTEFKWLGRFDTIINSGGIKLIPEQIEEKLAEVISQRFFVAGISDSLLGEKLILIVENIFTERIKNKDEASNTSTELNQTKKIIFNKIKSLQSLSKFEIPKEIYFVEQFIETETKKINRKETLKVVKNIY